MNPVLDNAQVFYHKLGNPLLYMDENIPSINELLFYELLSDLPVYDRRTLRRERQSIVVKRSLPDTIDEKTLATYKVNAINNIIKSSKYTFDSLINTTSGMPITPLAFPVNILQSNIKRLGF
jgi:hypothetical protein